MAQKRLKSAAQATKKHSVEPYFRANDPETRDPIAVN